MFKHFEIGQASYAKVADLSASLYRHKLTDGEFEMKRRRPINFTMPRKTKSRPAVSLPASTTRRILAS